MYPLQTPPPPLPRSLLSTSVKSVKPPPLLTLSPPQLPAPPAPVSLSIV